MSSTPARKTRRAEAAKATATKEQGEKQLAELIAEAEKKEREEIMAIYDAFTKKLEARGWALIAHLELNGAGGIQQKFSVAKVGGPKQ